MSYVYAYQSNPDEPPQFIAEDGELSAADKTLLHGSQCDSCGLTSYEVRISGPDRRVVCLGCDAWYSIDRRSEHDVEFP